MVFLYILLGAVTGLAGVLTAGALLYMYWIEIVLLYRTYWSKDETLGGIQAPGSSLRPCSCHRRRRRQGEKVSVGKRGVASWAGEQSRVLSQK